MDLNLDDKLGIGYSSNSQKSRVITEGWLEANMYCPICGAPDLVHFPASRAVADFYCRCCHSEFEQKSKESKRIPSRVAGGAFSAMERRLTSDENPHLFVLSYADGRVNNLILVPKHFFTMSVVKERKPTWPKGRPSPWIGSDILLDGIPEFGRIYIIKDGVNEKPYDVLNKYKLTLSLKTVSLTSRGWLLDVLRCVERIQTKDFTLADVYSFIPDLEKKHPGNKHINDKLRQQLQILRDKGLIDFIGRGKYRKK